MSIHLLPLLQLLSDGKFHSGDELGKSLNVSRAAIWKSIKKIGELGLDIHSVRGKGYRLSQPLDLLNREALLSGVHQTQQGKIAGLELLATVDSTNSHAMQGIQNSGLDFSQGKVLICLAEQQTAGKGRRGRDWVSPFGHNMYLSIAREFESGAIGLEGLSLVVGLALIRALKQDGIEGLGVKWPNDVLWENKKLAGILLEMSGDVTGTCQVVIGIGLNIRMETNAMTSVDQPWVDLSSISASLPERNQLIGKVIDEVLLALSEFEKCGFSGFMQEWAEYDLLEGHQIELRRSLTGNNDDSISGVAAGVSDNGALFIKTDSGVHSFRGGEVSVSKRVLNDS